MVRDDMEQGSKAILQTSIRALPADEWRRAPYLGGPSDSFWRRAEAFVPETDISEDPLLLTPEVTHEEADLIIPSSVLRFRVERGDIPCCFVNYEAVSQAPAHWGDWVESVLSNTDFVHTLRASRALEPVRLSTELSIRKNNTNLDLMISRWSKDTHTFVFPWGDGGPTLQDTAVLMRLRTRGSVALDPSNLSPVDAKLVERLRRAYTEAGKYGSRFDREGHVRAPPKSGKTSWGCWLRYFFKDLPPPGTVPPAGQASEFYGKMYDSDLHLAGFLVYWLSFFVIPEFPYEGPNYTVFPLAVSLARGDFVPLGPLFLGSLFHRLDQVHADTERSMGRYDMVSVVHTQFLMAFCFEHFPSLAPSPADISEGEEPRPRIMRWSGVSSTKPWGKRVDDADAFFPRPYAEPVEGALPTSFFSEDDRVVDFQTEGVSVSASALAAFAAACPCSLPALCAEGARSVLYRPDRVARQFGYDQGAPGQAPPLKSYVESLRRFTRAFVGELTEGFTAVVLPRNDRETSFTANSRLAWRRNLDSFMNYVRGVPEIPPFSEVYHRDVSLRSPKARQPGWRGKKSYWAPPTATPAASRGITIAEPISTVIPSRVTRAKAKEQTSLQEQGPQLKRLRKGAPTRATRAISPEEIPASVASVGSASRHEGKEHTPSSKLKRKREDEEAHEGDSDSSMDDTAPLSQFFKLPRATQSSPGGTSVAAGKQVVVDLAEEESAGTDSDSEGGDGRISGGVESSDADGSGDGEDGNNENRSGDDDGDENLGDDEEGDSAEDENEENEGGNDGDGDEGRNGGEGGGENLGADTTHPVVEEDEEETEESSLIPRRRVPTEGFLSVPDINQLAPEAVPPPLVRPDAMKSAFDLFNKRVNVPPAYDLAAHFQAHDAAVALTNLTSAEVFADLQDDTLISLETPQVGLAAGNFAEGSSSLAGGVILQQNTEASTSHGREVVGDDSDVRVVEPPATEEEEILSNEAFFGQFRLTRDETSFLSFIRDRFPHTFFKVRGLYSLTMGRMQLQCLHHFLMSIKEIRVCDLDLSQIEEIGQTVQNFDKLGFDIWWVYKELDAAKIMRANDKLWRRCEGAKAALGEAQAALAKARDAVVAAEVVVEERRQAYERVAEEARLGDRLIDVPLCDADPFLKNIFG
ncbi:hypothetical protein RHSIM_Rhsim04G0055800 [Rhododendron simsii]|uniref:Aminotransferase-like plant mobile domain-containing protein n=1 Tax=Rhododendron simsii TaxID=118357 RepID=A0A834H5D7_RHOSS|nr:hypothetical protein RHSIM_Rhsim04G0055800 [Rhododendron simsii]